MHTFRCKILNKLHKDLSFRIFLHSRTKGSCRFFSPFLFIIDRQWPILVFQNDNRKYQTQVVQSHCPAKFQKVLQAPSPTISEFSCFIKFWFANWICYFTMFYRNWKCHLLVLYALCLGHHLGWGLSLEPGFPHSKSSPPRVSDPEFPLRSPLQVIPSKELRAKISSKISPPRVPDSEIPSRSPLQGAKSSRDLLQELPPRIFTPPQVIPLRIPSFDPRTCRVAWSTSNNHKSGPLQVPWYMPQGKNQGLAGLPTRRPPHAPNELTSSFHHHYIKTHLANLQS